MPGRLFLKPSLYCAKYCSVSDATPLEKGAPKLSDYYIKVSDLSVGAKSKAANDNHQAEFTAVIRQPGTRIETYLIARLDDAGQLDGLLERLGEDANVLRGSRCPVICTRVFVKVWGCKTKCGHQSSSDVGL